MRTGVAYLGHHNPRHVQADFAVLSQLDCDDVLLAAQELDFVYFPGKLRNVPKFAEQYHLRPVVVLWGALNLFGGGRSSQFLLEHPECHQVQRDGSWHAAGCYNNPACIAYLQSLIDQAADLGFAGYFVDEPQLLDCFCASCRQLFSEWYGRELGSAGTDIEAQFRGRCVQRYVEVISAYAKSLRSDMETLCCARPEEKACWPDLAAIPTLDHLGTDLYWANEERDLEHMRPWIRELSEVCRMRGKRHHLWLQCWGVAAEKEDRIHAMGRIFIEEQPDALYVWAFQGQIGTNEACADPDRAWEQACKVLQAAKDH